MFNLKKKLSALALTSIMLLSSTGFVFADEKVNDIEMITVNENVNIERKAVVKNYGAEGWSRQGNKHYYHDENGKPLNGWQTVEGKEYYFEKDGQMSDGWTYVDKKTYYVNRENGKHIGVCKLKNGNTYNFDKEGVLRQGVVEVDGKMLYFNERGKLTSTAKAYKSNASAYSGHSKTSTGQKPRWGTIAVDPKVIPYGTKVYIPYFNKVFVANDCGGAIKGTKIDIFMNSRKECYRFGRRNLQIFVLDDIKTK